MKKSEGDRLKYAVCESTLSTAARSPFPDGEGKEEGASPPQKEANPALLRSAAPSKGRGSRGHFLLPMEGGAPKGRRLDGGSGMKKSEEDRLKCVVYENTRAPLRGPPSPRGKATTIRECRFSRIVRANTRICEKKNNDGQSLPLEGKVPRRGRIGHWRYERQMRKTEKCAAHVWKA